MWKARLAAKLFSWHIGLLDTINRNALVLRWIAEQHGRIPKFENLYDFHRHLHDYGARRRNRLQSVMSPPAPVLPERHCRGHAIDGLRSSRHAPANPLDPGGEYRRCVE
jgi:hypothetical protein